MVNRNFRNKFPWNLTHWAQSKSLPFCRRHLEWNLCNENWYVFIHNSLKFPPDGSINNKSSSVPIMAWRRTGDKPLSEISGGLVYWCTSVPLGLGALNRNTKFSFINVHLITSFVKYRPLRSGRNMLIHSLVPMCWLMLFWPSSNQSMNVISVDPAGRHPNNTITCNEPSAGLW